MQHNWFFKWMLSCAAWGQTSLISKKESVQSSISDAVKNQLHGFVSKAEPTFIAETSSAAETFRALYRLFRSRLLEKDSLCHTCGAPTFCLPRQFFEWHSNSCQLANKLLRIYGTTCAFLYEFVNVVICFGLGSTRTLDLPFRSIFSELDLSFDPPREDRTLKFNIFKV